MVVRGPASAWLALPPAWRRRLGGCALAALLLACGYLFWFRDSSFVAVERVTVTGVTSDDRERIVAALTSAARDMTTLHVRRDELELTAGSFPAVQGLEVEADFPHDLRIRVIEHAPVALVRRRGRRIPVAADGTLLPGLPLEDGLPTLRSARTADGGRLADGPQSDSLAVAAAAPASLRARLSSIAVKRRRGIVATVRGGPELVFGDTSRLRRKWQAAARVLADPSSRGASYVDVRSPFRPVAGGLPVETIQPPPPAGEPLDTGPPPAAAPPADAPAPQAAPTPPATQAPAPPAQQAPAAAAAPAGGTPAATAPNPQP